MTELKQAQPLDHHSVSPRPFLARARALGAGLLLALCLTSAPAQAAASGAAPTRSPAFDARKPDDLIAFLAAMDARAEIARRAQGQIFLTVTTPGGVFGAQMVGCDEGFASCKAIALYSAFSRRTVNMAQINDYNRSQLTCRGIMTPTGEPSVMYAILLSGRMNRDDLREHVGVWQGCLSGFGEFIQDPIGFLSRPQG